MNQFPIEQLMDHQERCGPNAVNNSDGKLTLLSVTVFFMLLFQCVTRVFRGDLIGNDGTLSKNTKFVA